MTRRERREPVIIDGSRRTRIARGSGTTVSAVNQLLKQFNEMRKMMRQMSAGSMPAVPGMGRMATMAQKAQRSEALPPGFEALGAGMKAGQSARVRRWQKQEEERREGYTPETTLNFDARVSRPVPVDRDKRFEGNFVVAVKLRLVRMGKKKQPTYRVVAAESRRARSGAFLGSSAPTSLGASRPPSPRPSPSSTMRRSCVGCNRVPTDRARRQAAQDQRRPGHVRGRQDRQVRQVRRDRRGRPVSDVNDYVAGDVNTIDDGYEDDDVNGSTRSTKSATPSTTPPRRPRSCSSSPRHSPRTPARSRSKSRSARARSSSR